jgi:RsiW-degrading membrane proteinase PrsW (M82 family)
MASIIEHYQAIIYALLGGIIPALIWLFFWLREDSKHSEPKLLILRTFVFGMISVLLVLPYQSLVDGRFPGSTALAFLLWAALEETFKFGAAYFGGLRSKEDNEPIDPIIYMITAALGFVALENALFILRPLIDGDVSTSILTINMRFLGANLLHIVSSGLVGAALAISFYRSEGIRVQFVLIALIIATIFHTAFNLLLMSSTDIGSAVAVISVWISVGGLLILFEKAKTIAP